MVRFSKKKIFFSLPLLFFFILLLSLLLFHFASKESKAHVVYSNTTYTTNQNFTNGLEIATGVDLIIDNGVTVNVSGGNIVLNIGSTITLRNGSTLTGTNQLLLTSATINVEDNAELTTSLAMIFNDSNLNTGVNSIVQITSNNSFEFYSNSNINLGAGTVIRCDHSFVVQDSLLRSIGTSGNNVVFESYTNKAPGGWRGIVMRSTTNYSEPDNGGTKFDHTTLRYGGMSNVFGRLGVLSIQDGATVGVYNSNFEDNIFAININESTNISSTIIDNTVFHNSSVNSPHIFLSPEHQPDIRSTTTFTGTGFKAIGLIYEINKNITLQKRDWAGITNIPYYLMDRIIIQNNSVVNLDPGVVIKSQGSNHFLVQPGSELYVNGTSTENVLFTSYKDDTIIGDTNSDGASIGDIADTSQYIKSNYGDVNIDYTEFKFSGILNNYSGANAITFRTSTSSCNNCIFTDGATAILIEGDASPTLHNLTFNNLEQGSPIATPPGVNPVLTGNYIFNNSYKFISLYGNAYSGNIINQNWPGTSNKVQYLQKGVSFINSGVTLNFDAGTVIKGLGSDSYRVNAGGVVNVNGTSTDKVIFTSHKDDTTVGDIMNSASTASRGDWHTPLNSTGGDININHSDIKYSGVTTHYSAYPAVWLRTTSSSINNTLFYEGNSAIYISGGISPTLGDIVYENLYASPIIMGLHTSPNLNGSFSFINSNKFVGIINDVDSTTLPVRYWPGDGAQIQYYFLNVIYVNNGVTVNVDPGVVIKVNNGTYFRVRPGGILNINGVNGNEVTFTSLQDDATIEDINNNVTSGGSGQSLQQVYTEGGDVNIDYTTFKYFGRTNYLANHAALTLTTSSSYCSNCTFTDGRTAIEIRDNVTPTLHNLTYTNIDRGSPISMHIDSNPSLTGTYSFTNSYKYIGIQGTSNAESTTVEHKTWGASGNTAQYKLLGALTIQNGHTINVDPNVVIKGLGSNNFRVQTGGAFNLNGTAGNEIIVTSERDDGTIEGVFNTPQIPGAGSYTLFAESYGGDINIHHTNFKYFGNNHNGMIIFETSNSQCNVCSFEIGKTAIQINGTISPSLNDLTYTDVIGYPIIMNLESTPSLSGNFSFTNSHKLLAFLPETVTQNTTLPVQNWPGDGKQIQYFIYNAVTIPNGVTVNLDPGVVIKGSSIHSSKFIVQNGGTFNANGNASSKVIMTTQLDDEVIEDITNDSASPESGRWRGLEIQNGGSVNVTNACIKHTVADKAAVSMTGNISNVSLSDVSFIDNDRALYSAASSVPNISFTDVDIVGATTCGSINEFDNLNSSNTINAENIYWDSTTGPNDPSDDTLTGGLYNPGGTGGCVSDYIDYEPYDTTPNNQVKVGFTQGAVSNSEDVTSYNVEIKLNGTFCDEITVDYDITGGDATIVDDYNFTNGTATFPVGEDTVTIPLTIVDDSDKENDETIEISLSNPNLGNVLFDTNQVLTYTIEDNNSAQIYITESGSSTDVTEDGATDTYDIVLSDPPATGTTVRVDITSNAQVSTSPTTYVEFDEFNWNTPQTVTVTAVDDQVTEGTHTGTITHTSISTDPKYDALPTIDSITVNITDNDTPGINITETGGDTTVNEEGPTNDTYEITLNSQPTNTVTISLTPDSQITLSTGSIQFNDTNWDTPQTITVTAVDDSNYEDNHQGQITHVSSSTDTNYNSLNLDLFVDIIDNDEDDGLYETDDSQFRLQFDVNSLGYQSNDPHSVDQNNEFKLSGGVENYDQGFGDTTGSVLGEFKIKTGLQPTFEAHVPEIDTLANTDGSEELYDKLLFSISPNNNPTSDDGAMFAVQISLVADFSNYMYINPTTFEPDQVTNSDLSIYYRHCAQTTSDPADDVRWNCGTVSGLKRFIKGLTPGTTYYVRSVSMNGDFTNSEPGPYKSQSTKDMFMEFTLSSNSANFGTLSNTAVNTATPSTVLTSKTNARNGYTVYVKGRGDGVSINSGLYDFSTTKYLESVDGNMDSLIGQDAYGINASIHGGTPVIDNKWLTTLAGRNPTYVGSLRRTSEILYSKSTYTTSTGDRVEVNYLANVNPATYGVVFQDNVEYFMICRF